MTLKQFTIWMLKSTCLYLVFLMLTGCSTMREDGKYFMNMDTAEKMESAEKTVFHEIIELGNCVLNVVSGMNMIPCDRAPDPVLCKKYVEGGGNGIYYSTYDSKGTVIHNIWIKGYVVNGLVVPDDLAAFHEFWHAANKQSMLDNSPHGSKLINPHDIDKIQTNDFWTCSGGNRFSPLDCRVISREPLTIEGFLNEP